MAQWCGPFGSGFAPGCNAFCIQSVTSPIICSTSQKKPMLRHSPPQPVEGEHAQPAEPIALRHPWGPVWTRDWTDKYSRDTRRTLSLAAGPWLPCSPSLTVLCLQLSSADSHMLGWHFTLRFPQQQSCTSSVPWMESWVSLQFCYPIPHHFLWQDQEQARHGTEFVSCTAPW